MTGRTRAVIIGSGNIGTDLFMNVKRLSPTLDVAAVVGVDPDSDGLARARRVRVETTWDGVQGRRRMAGDQEDLLVDMALEMAATS